MERYSHRGGFTATIRANSATTDGPCSYRPYPSCSYDWPHSVHYIRFHSLSCLPDIPFHLNTYAIEGSVLSRYTLRCSSRDRRCIEESSLALPTRRTIT